jgi:hypothetical protein
MATLADALAQLLNGLDRLEIPYYVGGSVASTFYGIYRTTNDVDLVADIAPEQAGELAECIGKDFYVDPETVRAAITRGRAFNVVHFASAYKIDIFPVKHDLYSQAAFARRAFRELRSLGPEPVECAVATAEDTVLSKLVWYRAGGEASERQWNDLRGIRMVSGAVLDYEYLRKWAPYLKVDDLLERLLAE